MLAEICCVCMENSAKTQKTGENCACQAMVCTPCLRRWVAVSNKCMICNTIVTRPRRSLHIDIRLLTRLLTCATVSLLIGKIAVDAFTDHD